eukprot:CAMPEP_0176334946 /NCGR_PEP_ID=MMETSP0121_2-20121125/78362_1 /TAXON_ID=160619 /ORGANISM="Kryptoperidinium foliaceum, Strain CCMP 1326" /LENGTH=301 /DNA_ID=CAMNT_0017677907 /DNA_START=98 /DNA_END=1001 /DNA_ORIENTATION=+
MAAWSRRIRHALCVELVAAATSDNSKKTTLVDVVDDQDGVPGRSRGDQRSPAERATSLRLQPIVDATAVEDVALLRAIRSDDEVPRREAVEADGALLRQRAGVGLVGQGLHARAGANGDVALLQHLLEAGLLRRPEHEAATAVAVVEGLAVQDAVRACFPKEQCVLPPAGGPFLKRLPPRSSIRTRSRGPDLPPSAQTPLHAPASCVTSSLTRIVPPRLGCSMKPVYCELPRGSGKEYILGIAASASLWNAFSIIGSCGDGGGREQRLPPQPLQELLPDPLRDPAGWSRGGRPRLARRTPT